MITPIHHYALTSGQPGIINEEAYTVLELVGQVGRKVNETITEVNNLSGEVGGFETRLSAVQQLAQQGVRQAGEANDAISDMNLVGLFDPYGWNNALMSGTPGELLESRRITADFADYVQHLIVNLLNQKEFTYDFRHIGNPKRLEFILISPNFTTPDNAIRYGGGRLIITFIPYIHSEETTAFIMWHFEQASMEKYEGEPYFYHDFNITGLFEHEPINVPSGEWSTDNITIHILVTGTETMQEV